MRKSFKTLLISMSLGMVFVSACSGGGSANNTKPAADGKTANTNNAGSADDAKTAGKHNPPITVAAVRAVDDTIPLKNGITVDNNVWLDYYKNELGINIKYQWVAKGADQFTQKMNVTLASGDLPDMISVNSAQLKQLIDAGQLQDLTDVYNKYAAPFTKEILNKDGTGPFDAATFNGKLWGLPQMDSSIDKAQFVWVRTDWLEKLHLQPPKTMQDLLAVAKAFVTQDPDGNGKNDTFGLAVTKDLWSGFGGLEGYFNGFHANPNIWIKDQSGQLVNGSIQPEVKTALKQLQDMYKDGQLDKEFGAKPSQKVAEDVDAGKIGIEFGQQWNSLWPLTDGKKIDPKSQWQAFPIVSIDGQPAKSQITMGTRTWVAAKKGFDHPEAIVQLFNAFLEKNWGKTAEVDKYYMPQQSELEGIWKLSPVTPSPPTKNLDAFVAIRSAVDSGKTGDLTGEPLSIFKKLDAYKNGDQSFWGWERIYGPDGSFKSMNEYQKKDLFMRDQFNGAATPTMVSKNAVLQELQAQTYTQIIMGKADIGEFDNFVDKWKKLGGDQITKEVNDWYKTVQGK